MMFEIYQSGFELTIQEQTFNHNCSIFSGTKEQCEERIKIHNLLPYKHGTSTELGIISKMRVVELSETLYMVTMFGYKHNSPIMGSELLHRFIVNLNTKSVCFIH